MVGSGAATPTYAASTSSQFEGALLRNRSLGQDILPSPGQPKRTESLYVTPGRGSTASGAGGGGGGLSKVSPPTFTHTRLYIYIFILYLLTSFVDSLVNQPVSFVTSNTYFVHFRVTKKDSFFFFFFWTLDYVYIILAVFLSPGFRKEKATWIKRRISGFFFFFFCKTE